jgi:hypothetical protein
MGLIPIADDIGETALKQFLKMDGFTCARSQHMMCRREKLGIAQFTRWKSCVVKTHMENKQMKPNQTHNWSLPHIFIP